MVNIEKIKNFLQQQLNDEQFIVDVRYNPQQEKYSIFVDSFKNIKLSDCEEIHKKLNKLFTENQDNSAIEVSSPGLTSNLIVWQQFKKNIGNLIHIETTDNQIFEGKIESADQNCVVLNALQNNQNIEILLNTIKKAKLIIKF